MSQTELLSPALLASHSCTQEWASATNDRATSVQKAFAANCWAKSYAHKSATQPALHKDFMPGNKKIRPGL